MRRDVLISVCIALLVVIPLGLKRKPEQMACASDTYAKAITVVRNIARHGRGQPQLTCVPGTLTWLR